MFLLVVDLVRSCMYKGTECIGYTIIRNGTDFEERLYPPSKWITARTRAPSVYEASRKSFMKLVYYIQAFNKQNVTVDLTTPHRTKIYWGAGGRSNAEYSLSFPLPKNLYKDPPKANDPSVVVENEPATLYLVKKFAGRPSEGEWIEIAKKFYRRMKKYNVPIEKNYFYTARYDMVYFINERRNEIWLPLAP
ncbi:heme-binding protein 2-like [Galendromus occidentalis]|uniref:Heme-binding protein 2-like n=1 Tax=Galendromus occidentalis TaxID=34638 RepID=A0AAJ7WJQ3_9ACAR|nr:heme-binding protein 2-like [Galendromus occidentalis]